MAGALSTANTAAILVMRGIVVLPGLSDIRAAAGRIKGAWV
jgi:hypothetical protein